ncbi:two-component system, NarL family, sensor histidine kinase UhpB [Frateuria terrea]|uniref:histidine kinase n=2 Tax=Frateuria terrea TaxID=529704 RepID=A0A1H6TNW6_9GAMM|nr:two-component system, NarL family, sensor histidine kinase UhpB [Frateuria terrea]SFP41132.1 two-component system, NarL family, sensor histidine kinase UhpB [Frateuria terrea]
MYHPQMRSKPFSLPDSGPLLGVLYVLLWLVLLPTQQPYWMLPFGLRFAALLIVPVRQWFWLLGLELAATAILDLRSGLPMGWETFLIGDLPEPLVMAVGLWLLRRVNLHASLRDPEEATRLLLSAVLVVGAVAATDAVLLALLHESAAPSAMIRALGRELLGNYLGVLLVAPLAIMLLRARPNRKMVASLVMDGLLVMLPAMALLLMLSEHAAPQPEFARVLSLAPVLFFAFRHGWRGATLAMLISCMGMAAVDHQPGHAQSAAGYLFLAVAGTGALMLGAATDALRRSSERVAEQNVYLGAVNRRLDQLARQLRDAARGNLQAEENQRRHMAAELHDELGQNITAIQTHMKLAQVRLRQAGLEDISVSINTILGYMRRALHRLLDDLRPAVLDEFGLLRALDEGPIRDLLTTAGIFFHTDMRGDPRLLDEDTRTAVYRLVQESATNAVKHAQASEFRLRLRIGERHGVVLALLDIRDDGVGLPNRLPRGGRGLQGMRDRVTSLGGLFRLRPDRQGVHLRILLRGSTSGREPGRLA